MFENLCIIYVKDCMIRQAFSESRVLWYITQHVYRNDMYVLQPQGDKNSPIFVQTESSYQEQF